MKENDSELEEEYEESRRIVGQWKINNEIEAPVSF